MKRKAVLIEAWNPRGQSEIPGAKVDVENWRRFLLSELGGAWAEAEIRTYSKPSSATVASELAVAADTYLYVAFSGHGCDGSVVLNDWEQDFEVDRLRPCTTKGTLIVDSCRGSGGARQYAFGRLSAANIQLERALNESLVLTDARAGRASEFRSEAILNRTITSSIPIERYYWDVVAKGCPAGVVQMLSCAKGQGAGEDAKSGGYYTSLLLQSADAWGRVTSETGFHSTKDAHDFAARNLPPQQTPEYSPMGLAFPFAVKFKS